MLKEKDFEKWTLYCAKRYFSFTEGIDLDMDFEDSPEALRGLVACALNVGNQVNLKTKWGYVGPICPLCRLNDYDGKSFINEPRSCDSCLCSVHFGEDCSNFRHTVENAIELYELEYKKIFG